MIFHIPHSSKVIPAELRDTFLLKGEELDREILLMTDHYTDELFMPCVKPDDSSVIFPVSRLVVDVERFESDDAESMSEIGMGVIYESTSNLGSLREKPSSQQREQLLQDFYRPHHHALEEAVEDELGRNGYAQIIDCHSFPSTPLPYERDKATDRPHFCLGLDEFHTNPDLAELTAGFLRSSGFTVKLNSPFSGAIVSTGHYQSDGRVQSLMVEINRSLYMEEQTGEKTATYSEIQQVIAEAVDLIRKFPRA